MKEENPFDKEYELKMMLDNDHVEIPELPLKFNRWDRYIHFLASPTKNPLESLISESKGSLVLNVAPLLTGIGLALLQAIVYLF